MSHSLGSIGKLTALILTLVTTQVFFGCAPAAPAPTSTSAPKAAATIAPAKAPGAEAKTGLAQIVDAANKEGKVVWYESSPETDIAKVAAEFNKKYPAIKVEQVRLTGADVGTRILTESQAGGPTADVGTSGAEVPYELNKQGIVAHVNWADLGIDPKLAPSPEAVSTTAATYVVVINTKLVSDAEAPKSWDDLLNPKWKGRIGTWIQPQFQAQLVPAWGADKTTEWVKKFAAQQPVFKQSTFPISEAVAAGELPLGVIVYHTAKPLLEKNAPIKIIVLDPTPVTMLHSFIPTKASHPNAAKVFMAWLHSTEGNLAYENATGRGNPKISGTATAKLLAGKNLSEYPYDKQNEFSKWLKEYGGIMSGK